MKSGMIKAVVVADGISRMEDNKVRVCQVGIVDDLYFQKILFFYRHVIRLLKKHDVQSIID